MRLVRALIAARADRAVRVRAAFLAAFDPLGHPGFAVPVRDVAKAVGALLKEPWSRGLEHEVLRAARAALIDLVVVGGRRLLVGVRRRGQSVAEAVEEGRRVRAEATGVRRRRGPGREAG